MRVKMVPPGAMMGRNCSQLGWTEVVTRSWSMGRDKGSVLAILIAKNSVAPSLIASSLLLSELEKTTTSQPIFAANWMARCPKPPIPITPTRSVGLVPKDCRA